MKQLKMRSCEEILQKILYNMFFEELKKGNIVPTDQLKYVMKDEQAKVELYHKWLIKNGYADKNLMA